MAIHFSDTSIPRYLQIADLMRQRIARGEWTPGEKLPSLEALVAEFGVARVTVRQAIDLLAREALVSPQRGRGTFVTAQPPRTRWLKVQTTLDELATVYRDTKPEIVNIDESIARAPLQPEDGTAAERYVFMRRVHSQGGQPYCVIRIYLDERIFRRAPDRFRNETVITVLADIGESGAAPSGEAGVAPSGEGGAAPSGEGGVAPPGESPVAHARQVLTIGTADMEVARLLQVPVNSPVAEVRRVFTDAQGRVIYLGEVTYRGDFIHLDMVLKP